MRRRQSYTFLALAALPLLVALQNPKWSEPLHLATLTLLKPFLQTGDGLSDFLVHSKMQLVHFWKSFRSQEALENRVKELESKLERFSEMERENERLKKIFEFKRTIPEKAIGARVIGWDVSPWRKTVILDKGLKEGIKKDMAVVVPEGLVGRILEAGPTASRAILLTDPDARVASLADQGRAQGVVMGSGSRFLKMGYLDLDSGVAVEETVLTSGIGGLFPKGLRIGKIMSLGKDSSGLHLEAQIQPFASFSKLEEVLCLESSRAA